MPIVGCWTLIVAGPVFGEQVTVARLQRSESFSVKAPDQFGDGIPRSTPGSFGRLRVAHAIGHGQQGFGPGDMGSGFSVGAADANEQLALLLGERSERVFLAARHGSSPGEVLEGPAAYLSCA